MERTLEKTSVVIEVNFSRDYFGFLEKIKVIGDKTKQYHI
jgi:hypothetical protein